MDQRFLLEKYQMDKSDRLNMNKPLGCKKVCIVSFTPVFDEPRVCRQARALYEAGADVTVIGYKGRGKCPSFWNFIELNLHPQISSSKTPSPLSKQKNILLKIMNVGIVRISQYAKRFQKLSLLLLSRFSKHAAISFFWRNHEYQNVKKNIPPVAADLYIAHDYFTLPIALYLSSIHPGKVAFDAHEHATTQYAHSLWFRWIEAPYVHSLQEYLFPHVHCFTTVCDGIADLLKKEYHLPQKPFVIRSTPFYEAHDFKKTDPKNITLLYHGGISPMRGLEEVIESAPSWHDHLTMIMRGHGDPHYINKLKEIIKNYSLCNKIRIESSVAASRLVSYAHRDADIGYFAQPQISPQKRYTLPNKFFEYTMAGLCLVVNKGYEMKKLCDHYQNGVFVNSLTKEDIAHCLNSLTPEVIDRCKEKSLHAAKELCFDREGEKMIQEYASLF